MCVYIYALHIYIHRYIWVTSGFAPPPAESKGSFLSPSWVNAGGRVCQAGLFVWQHVSKFTVGTGGFQENKRAGGR